MESGEHANEASHLTAIPEIDFLIPRKPIQKSSGPSVGIHTPSPSDSKHESSQHGDLPRTTRRSIAQHFPRWLRDWWLETACCVVFTGALMAIVGAILPYQDQPLPQWPYNVSINTLISILIAISKAAMLLVTAEGISQLKWTWFLRKRPLQDMARYDMASRGPWGSLRLLLSLRGRDLVASVGAFVTVASIAIDPFAQQIVRYDPCIVFTPSVQAALPRTNSYSEHGVQIYAGINQIPASVQGSINAGIFTPGTTNISFNCPTGNCTFPQDYHSLAFCSSCVDSTTNLTVTIKNSTNHSFNYTSYNYSLPSGTYSWATAGQDDNMTLFVMQGVAAARFTVELIINPWPNEVEYYQQINTAQCIASNNVSFGCNGIGAATCSLFPCIKTYTGLVKDGYVSEQVESTWTSFSGDIDQYALNVGCLDQRSRAAVLAQGHTIDPNAKWIAYNNSQDLTMLPNGTWIMSSPILEQVATGDCMYQFSGVSLRSLGYFWSSYFHGNMSVPGSADQPQGSSSVVYVVWDRILNDSEEFFANQTYQFQNLSQIFEDVAESLTLHIRENGDANRSVAVTGEIGHDSTCVHVYWDWLAFPFALVVLTILFFVVMVFRTDTEQDRFHGWKSSPLALIYHGLDRETLARHNQGSDIEDMIGDAQTLHVRLSYTDQGWKLANVYD